MKSENHNIVTTALEALQQMLKVLKRELLVWFRNPAVCNRSVTRRVPAPFSYRPAPIPHPSPLCLFCFLVLFFLGRCVDHLAMILSSKTQRVSVQSWALSCLASVVAFV